MTQIRESVGLGSEVLAEALNDALSKIERAYSFTVAPLHMRLLCTKPEAREDSTESMTRVLIGT